MEGHDDHICIDRVVPPEYAQIAISRAIAENDSNRKPPGSPFEAAALRSKLWAPGRTLLVSFLDGTATVHERVKHYASRWCKHAHIFFDFGNHSKAHIRISFADTGSWSAVGTDALVLEYFKPDEPTMNFGWLRPDSADAEYQRVVLHEFGHALGLIHEHQSPDSGMQWDAEAVYRRYSGAPNYWDRETIDRNILKRYEATQTQFTKFDRDSIMLYSYPAELTLNRRGTKQNTDLSAQDIAFIGELYPADRTTAA